MSRGFSGGFRGAMQSDDLFLRKMRGPSARQPPTPAPPVAAGGVPSSPPSPSPSPSPGGAAPRQRSSSEAALGRPSGDGGAPAVLSPRSRTQSHEEAAGGGSPSSPRFRDPLLLLGLTAAGCDPDFFPRLPWSPLLAHYDVQSILFDPTEPPPGPPGLTSGASAAHLEPEEPPGSPRAAPDPEALVLSCPRFCCETGGEQEPGLGSPQGPPGPGQLPNAAVAVLEEPPAGARPPHPIEHSDEGAEYYRKYFYGKGELGAGGTREGGGQLGKMGRGRGSGVWGGLGAPRPHRNAQSIGSCWDRAPRAPAGTGGSVPGVWGGCGDPDPLGPPPEHHNLLGEDPRLGPVAVSLRREEKEGPRPQVLHRIILRTCQVSGGAGGSGWVKSGGWESPGGPKGP